MSDGTDLEGSIMDTGFLFTKEGNHTTGPQSPTPDKNCTVGLCLLQFKFPLLAHNKQLSVVMVTLFIDKTVSMNGLGKGVDVDFLELVSVTCMINSLVLWWHGQALFPIVSGLGTSLHGNLPI